jgi:hypothetical protein
MNNWSELKKIGFRFLFPFFILWTSVWNLIPYVDQWIYQFYYYPSFFVQNFILRLWDSPGWEHSPTGSGDTLDDWILLFAYLTLSIIICFVWTLVDRNRTNYSKLETGLCIGLRYYLAFVMFGYGIDKLFLLQMPYPSLTQLYTPLGEFTPMRLTWMHIGYSHYYQFIGGLLETLGGLLILFRKTKFIGGLLLLIVMTQVAMLNYFYGVPVKIFSTFLLLVIIYILKDNLLALGKFVLGRENQKIIVNSLSIKNKWLKIVRIILKISFIAYAFGATFYYSADYYFQQKEIKNISLYGAYKVIEYRKIDKDTTSKPNSERWNYVVFGEGLEENQSSTLIRQGYSSYIKAKTTITSLDSINIAFSGDESIYFIGKYIITNDIVELSGKIKNDVITVKLKKDNHKLVLPNKQFKWIMEQSDF